MNSQQIRENVNAKLIEALSKNILPWRRPWSSGGSGRHRNFQSNRPYSGVNPCLLELHNLKHGFSSNRWLTFNQAKALDLTIKKRPAHCPPGQWGCSIILARPLTKTVVDQKTGEEKDKSFFMLRSFMVFNVLEQMTGRAVDQFQEERPVQPVTGSEYPEAEQLLIASQAKVIHNNGDKAYYARPLPEGTWPNHTDGDYIVLPERRRFESVEAYYETAFHELAHHSEVRLGWNHLEYGYSAGELVAEIASTYTASELGMPLANLQNHAAYLQSWLAGMKESPSFIFQACSQSSKVADYLLNLVRPIESDAIEESEESTVAVAA